MSGIRCSETQLEIAVRSSLHRDGFRFRKNLGALPGKPDVVLRKYSAVIFVAWNWRFLSLKNELREPDFRATLANYTSAAPQLTGLSVNTLEPPEFDDAIYCQNFLLRFLDPTPFPAGT